MDSGLVDGPILKNHHDRTARVSFIIFRTLPFMVTNREDCEKEQWQERFKIHDIHFC